MGNIQTTIPAHVQDFVKKVGECVAARALLSGRGGKKAVELQERALYNNYRNSDTLREAENCGDRGVRNAVYEFNNIRGRLEAASALNRNGFAIQDLMGPRSLCGPGLATDMLPI